MVSKQKDQMEETSLGVDPATVGRPQATTAALRRLSTRDPRHEQFEHGHMRVGHFVLIYCRYFSPDIFCLMDVVFEIDLLLINC